METKGIIQRINENTNNIQTVSQASQRESQGVGPT